MANYKPARHYGENFDIREHRLQLAYLTEKFQGFPVGTKGIVWEDPVLTPALGYVHDPSTNVSNLLRNKEVEFWVDGTKHYFPVPLKCIQRVVAQIDISSSAMVGSVLVDSPPPGEELSEDQLRHAKPLPGTANQTRLSKIIQDGNVRVWYEPDREWLTLYPPGVEQKLTLPIVVKDLLGPWVIGGKL